MDKYHKCLKIFNKSLDIIKIIRIFVKHKFNNMKTFKDLLFETHPMGAEGGVLAREDFDNGFGITVVKGPYTYGGEKGLYELAVWKNGEIHYDNDVAKGDVVGYLRAEDVTDAMLVIQKFK